MRILFETPVTLNKYLTESLSASVPYSPWQFALQRNPSTFNYNFYFILRHSPVPFKRIQYFFRNVCIIFGTQKAVKPYFNFFHHGFNASHIFAGIFCFCFFRITIIYSGKGYNTIFNSYANFCGNVARRSSRRLHCA